MINKKNLQILESKQKLAINVLVGVCTLCSCNSMMAMEHTPGGPNEDEVNIHASSNIHASKGGNVGGEANTSLCCTSSSVPKEMWDSVIDPKLLGKSSATGAYKGESDSEEDSETINQQMEEIKAAIKLLLAGENLGGNNQNTESQSGDDKQNEKED